MRYLIRSGISVREGDRWLEDREPVIVVSLHGETKAHPIQILMWRDRQ